MSSHSQFIGNSTGMKERKKERKKERSLVKILDLFFSLVVKQAVLLQWAFEM